MSPSMMYLVRLGRLGYEWIVLARYPGVELEQLSYCARLTCLSSMSVEMSEYHW